LRKFQFVSANDGSSAPVAWPRLLGAPVHHNLRYVRRRGVLRARVDSRPTCGRWAGRPPRTKIKLNVPRRWIWLGLLSWRGGSFGTAVQGSFYGCCSSSTVLCRAGMVAALSIRQDMHGMNSEQWICICASDVRMHVHTMTQVLVDACGERAALLADHPYPNESYALFFAKLPW
jgi:hypothetical protein